MIPRIIHSAWFGRGEKSDLFKRCMENQRKLHPGWTFMETDEDSSGLMDTVYMRSVLGRKEYVKATELARLWALYTYGGVYLDCDVECVRNFEPLLHFDFFIGREDEKVVCGAVIGSEKKGETISKLLQLFPMQSPGHQRAVEYGPTFLTACIDIENTLPPHAFYPYHWRQEPAEAVIAPDTFAVHHWAKSWL